ncbi:MAG: bifunctional metallophosphatase/5'-nucleotidase [Oscillospiraceae bacterium]|nr:bifunctional metallophosphatase/5'-nucleotidase [Oscillospiraceae bacterium]
MKKLIALLLAVCMVLGLMTTVFAADEKSNDIVILHTDDAHCGVNDNLGYAGVAAYKAEMEKTHNYVALVDCGDAIQGESIGTLSAGAYLVDIMNEVGYDFATFGNHEFDYKLPQLAKLTKQAKYQYLACNFKYIGKGTSDLNYKPYEIVTYGDKKVAFIGIVTPESFTKSTPAYFQDESGNYIYSFSEDETGTALYETVQKTVDEARAAGADYVIAMGHLGNEGITDRWTSKAVIANTTGIDAVLDGHDHIAGVQKVANKDGKQIVLTEPGTKFENLGKLTIKTDGTITAELISPKEFTEKDAGITAYITKLTDTFKEYVSKVVAKSSIALPDKDENGNRLVRNHETALGDLCADAFRVMMDADIGIMNGGGIRKPIKAGDITLDNILSVFPWGNLPCKMEVTGQTVLDMLEMGAINYPEESGGFLSVSGLKYTIMAGVPSSIELTDKGEFSKVAGKYRVTNVQVLNKKTNEYEPLDLNKTYTLGGIDYTILYCGDGFTMFNDSKVLKAGDASYTDAQMVVDYIENKLGGTIGEEYAKPQGRISVNTDIKGSDWFYEAVNYVLSNGLMTGTSDTTFTPNGALTRGMLVTVLYRMAGSPKVEGKVSEKFSDCTDGSWYADAVLWASANKVVDGYEDGTFKPTKSITRQEMAKVLYGYDKIGGKTAEGITEKLTYTDLDAIADWALEAVTYCTAEKYLAGSNGAFSPKGTATRAMGAKVLMNMTKEAA